MEKQELKIILIEQNQKKSVDEQKDIIEREILNKINKEDNFIKIISGIRRCGKSTFLRSLWEKNDGYFVNFDDERFINFTIEDFQKLNEILIELFGLKENYFFDEIQNIYGWERFVRRLHDYGKKIFITGSNATMLSKELGTHLTGRHILIEMYPFSFKEFLEYKKIKIKNFRTTEERAIIKRYFNEYAIKGGFPEFLKTENKEYIKTLYENLIYRDIINRYKLQNEKTIRETILYAVSNIGKEISFNQIRKLTGLSSATTIKEYFNYIENCYLAFLINVYDKSLKKQIYSNKKVYFIDSAIIDILGFRAEKDIGRILENLVFIELKRRGKEIYFYKENNECDFLVKEGINIREAIQVTLELTQKNKEREINGLLETMKKFKLEKGLILTENEENQLKIDKYTIDIIPIWRWIIEN